MAYPFYRIGRPRTSRRSQREQGFGGSRGLPEVDAGAAERGYDSDMDCRFPRLGRPACRSLTMRFGVAVDFPAFAASREEERRAVGDAAGRATRLEIVRGFRLKPPVPRAGCLGAPIVSASE